MNDLIFGGEYTYTDLMNHASNKWLMQDHGKKDSIIGETFLVFKPLEDIKDPPDVCDDAVLSFVMIGYTTQGIYRLIYKYTR